MCSTEEKLSLFSTPKWNDSIVREEVHTYYPHTRSFDKNDVIEITINQQDAFISFYESSFCIEGSVEVIGGEIADSCALTSNFGLFLFESISYDLCGTELEKVREPGLNSYIRGLLLCNTNNSKALEPSGWSYPLDSNSISKKTSFNIRIPLKFIFGIFDDYQRILMGKHKFTLVRSRSDNNCYKATGQKSLSLNISSIELKAKHIFPNDLVKLQLLENLNKDSALFIPFRKWSLFELPSLNASNKEIWSVKNSLNLEKPRYLIICFQTNRKNNPKSSATAFDLIDLSYLRAYLNSEVYPHEAMRFNSASGNWTEAYQAYVDFQKSYFNKNTPEPLMTQDEFLLKPIFVIDCSKQNDSIQQSTVDLKLEFETSKIAFPTNTRAYCVVINDSCFEYHPLSGIVRSLV